MAESTLKNAWHKLWFSIEQTVQLPSIQNSELKDLSRILDLTEADMAEWIWQDLNEKALPQLSDSEIISMIQNVEEVEIIEENLDEVEQTQFKKPSSTEVFRAVDIIMKYLQNEPTIDANLITSVHSIKNFVASKKMKLQQTKLTEFFPKRYERTTTTSIQPSFSINPATGSRISINRL